MRWALALLLVPIIVAGVVFLLSVALTPTGGACTAPICGPLKTIHYPSA